MAHFGVSGPQNESKRSNLLKKTSKLKSETQRTLKNKIILKNNISYRERGTVIHFSVKVAHFGIIVLLNLKRDLGKKIWNRKVLYLWKSLIIMSFQDLEKVFKYRRRSSTGIIFKLIEKFVFVPYLWVNYLVFLHNHTLEFFVALKYYP